MKIKETDFDGLMVIEPFQHRDERGTLNKVWIKEKMSDVIEDNFETYISNSKAGVFRGLHLQLGENAQGKYITCIHGNILDVAIDLREGSSTYGAVFKYELTSKGGKGLFIPKGFAHGFYSMTDSVVMNLCDAPYAPESEIAINWESIEELKDLNVKIISEKDSCAINLETFLKTKI